VAGGPAPRLATWGLSGAIGYGLSQWLMLLVLARLGTPAEVGRFTVGLALTAPIVMLTNSQLGWVQATDSEHEYSFGEYRRQRWLASSVAGGLILLVGFSFGGGADFGVIALVGAAKIAETFNDLYAGHFQRHSRVDLSGRSQLIRGTCSLFLFGAAVAISRRLEVGLVALAVGSLLVLSLHDRPAGNRFAGGREEGHASINWPRVGRLTIRLIPLGFAALIISLNTSLPRMIVEGSLGREALGVFAAMAYLIVAGRMVAAPLGHIAAPRIGAAVARRDRRAFWVTLRRLLGIGALMGAIGVIVSLVAGRALLTVLYGSEFAGSAQVLPWLMGVAALGYLSSFCQIAAIAAGKAHGLAAVALLTLVATGVVGGALVTQLGMVGMAAGMLVAAAVELVGCSWLVHRSLAWNFGSRGATRPPNDLFERGAH